MASTPLGSSPGRDSPKGERFEPGPLIAAEQVAALYDKAVVPFLTVVVNASLVAFVLGGTVPTGVLAAWLSAMFLVAAARVVLLWAYRRNRPPPERAGWWGLVFTLGTALNGVVWGSSALLLFPSGQVATQVFLLFVLGGMTAGATASTASYRPAFPAFALPALLPMVVRLTLEGGSMHWAMGGMTALFGVAMSTIARSTGNSLAESARLRYKNVGLVVELNAAQARLTEVLRGLEQRVAERTAALEATLLAQRETEAALRRQKELFQAVFDHTPVLLAVFGEDGRIQLANGALEDRIGWSFEDYLAKGLGEGVAPAPDFLRSVREHVGMGNGVWRDFMVPTRDGQSLHMSWASVRLSEGQFVAIGQDTTERKRAQERLALSERMASVGTLAAGVAHEINNPLSFVLANQEFVLERVREALTALEEKRVEAAAEALRETESALGDAHVGADRVSRVVADLKSFSRVGETPTRVVEIVPVLESCLRMGGNDLRHRARLVKEFGHVPPVLANEGRLSEVFLNLIVNAVHAIPEGAAANHEICVKTRTDAAGRAVVEISDTGEGIPPAALPRIFDPFFTTKPVGQGTGLGLSICHGIVSSLGGHIEVESELGKGSRFRVVLSPGSARETSESVAMPSGKVAPGER